MRRPVPGLLLLCVGLGAGAAEPPKPTADVPLPQLPYTRGLETAFMDKSADPCEDFYKYSCGGWQKLNPIPADQSSWSVFGKLTDGVERHLWALLLEAGRPGAPPLEKQLGDYFAACMDEKTLEAKGSSPLKETLAALEAVKTKAELAGWVAQANLSTGSPLLFRFDSEQDASDSTQYLTALYAGGLGLPDRDDYLDKDPRSVEIRARYVPHVEALLALLGDEPAAAKAAAQKILRLETALAKASLTRVERRDPYKVFHKQSVAQLAKLAPAFDWRAYFAGVGLPAIRTLNVSQPKFVQQLNALLAKEPLADLKTYLRWRLVDQMAEHLSRAFVEEDFAFNRKFLRGAQELAPRWKRCVQYADRDLTHALGQLFVKKNFSPQLREKTLVMVQEIQREMGKDLETLDWMSPATRKQARRKLDGMANKLGYPEVWRDYAAVTVTRDDFAGNVSRAAGFEVRRRLGRIGKAIDRKEWSVGPQEVNAYYDAQLNDMNFPAGVLQPPLFDARMDDAPNYGDTGATVGHELTHGFDDEGRQFDAAGNLKDWWTPKDAAEFNRRAKCISDQYSSYLAVDDIHVNGKLTLGEDVADLGGLLLAYRAWKTHTAGQTLHPIDGLTPEQRFFVGYAQWACASIRPETSRLYARIDPHSPPKYRVNGLVVNIPEFAAAFSCKAGQAMTKPPEAVCKVW